MTVKLWDEDHSTLVTVGTTPGDIFSRVVPASAMMELVSYVVAYTTDVTKATAGRWIVTTGLRRSSSGFPAFINSTATTILSAVTDAGLSSATVTYTLSLNTLNLHLSSGTSDNVNWAAVTRVLLYEP